jgi:prolyl 4-hydroxylase
MAPWSKGHHGGGGIPIAATATSRRGSNSGLIAPPLGPGLPARISTHAAVSLIVVSFVIGRLTTPGALSHLPGSTLASSSSSAAAATPSSSSSSQAAAALPLPTLPASVRAISSADQRHTQLSAAIARGEVNATDLLPDMQPLGRAWMRESGLLALRPPLPVASSARDGVGGRGPASSSSSSSEQQQQQHDYVVQPFQVLSWQPRIVLFPNFIDATRRARIIELARPRLEHSTLAWRPDEKADPHQKTRTSKGTFLSRHDDPSGTLAWLEEKIAAVTYLPVSYQEAANFLEYGEGAHYASHMDSFDPKDFGPQQSQRLATVLVILDEPEAGGETIFLREGKNGDKRVVTDWSDCSATAGGYRYAPRSGDALLFFSLTPDGQIDPRSLHGGCPVIGAGKKKRVLTKWIHNKPISAGWASSGSSSSSSSSSEEEEEEEDKGKEVEGEVVEEVDEAEADSSQRRRKGASVKRK